MQGKYEALTAALRKAAARGQRSIEFSFADIADLVGGLPPSASVRQWWANSSHVQGLAWRAAGFRVDQVYLDRGRVRFALGEGGRRGHSPRGHSSRAPTLKRSPIADPIDVRVRLQWFDAGLVTLDQGGKVTFGEIEQLPGLYRMTLTKGVAGSRTRVYIGETDDLRRRLRHYRNPGFTQQTNVRVNALLRDHLAAGGAVGLAVATAATSWFGAIEQPLDLARKAGRLLAENAALVLAQATSDAEIVNLE